MGKNQYNPSPIHTEQYEEETNIAVNVLRAKVQQAVLTCTLWQEDMCSDLSMVYIILGRKNVDGLGPGKSHFLLFCVS